MRKDELITRILYSTIVLRKTVEVEMPNAKAAKALMRAVKNSLKIKYAFRGVKLK